MSPVSNKHVMLSTSLRATSWVSDGDGSVLRSHDAYPASFFTDFSKVNLVPFSCTRLHTHTPCAL